MRYTMAVIALCLSAAMSDAATNGITVYHKFVGTHDSMTHTCWQAANGTAYDKAVIYGPDGGTITKTSALHKTLSGVGPKIGEVTPNTNGGGSGGGGGGKLNGPDGDTPSGITVVFVEPSTHTITTSFVADPYTCGTIFYSLQAGYWHTDSSSLNPCANGSPLPSSTTIQSSLWWKPEWMKSDG